MPSTVRRRDPAPSADEKAGDRGGTVSSSAAAGLVEFRWTSVRPPLGPDGPAVDGGGAEFLLDPEELVVLGDPVGARRRARLDLAGVGGHGDVGDRRVLGLARPVADDGRIGVALGHLDGFEGLGQGADLNR